MTESLDLHLPSRAVISGPVKRAAYGVARGVKILLVAFALWMASQTLPAEAASSHSFVIGTNAFLLDGRPFQIRGGEIQFARVPREYWRHRLKLARAMGLNTVCTPLFWNLHEPRPGEFNWSGEADAVEFCRIAQEEGLWVILRPGPYVGAEWEMGGLPWWLLKDEAVQLRSRDPRFMEPARRYLAEVGHQLASLQISQGGPILMVQVENEYGSFGTDTNYLHELRETLVKTGFEVPLLAADSVPHLRGDFDSGLFPVVNFGSDPEGGFNALRAVLPEGPLMCGEYQSGGSDLWGAPHRLGDVNRFVADLNHMLRSGVSFNLYLAQGGTSFGLWSGTDRPFKPNTSSYDYDAPISEAGWPREKFFKTRERLVQLLTPGESLPELPPTNRVIFIPPFEATECAPLFKALPLPINDASPRTMEQYNQGHGCILYRAILPAGPACTLETSAVHDFGFVFVDGERVGVLDRRNRNFKVRLPARRQPATLDILVEAMGRVSSGAELNDPKGLVGPVSLTPSSASTLLKDWQVFLLPLDQPMLAGLRYDNTKTRLPAFWRATVNLTERGDTFLDMQSWGKGIVWVNGHCLGRFWNIGPSQTMYVPSPWLKPGQNEIVILDLLGPELPVLAGLEQPLQNQSHPERDFFNTRSLVRLKVDTDRPVHAGQFSEGSELQEVLFASPIQGRYFSLDTLSAHDGKPYGAIGELGVLDASGKPLDYADWKVIYVDSEEHEREDGAAENAIDGQPGTFWHSQWSSAPPNHPHRLLLDLGSSHLISGFRYTPRQGSSEAGGRIKDYRINIGNAFIEEKPPAELLPETCYLFSYFKGAGEDGLHLAWSLDGYRWDEVDHGRSILKPELTGTNLIRDPCLLRAPDGTYHLVWTTLWTGQSIGYASSKDLMHWSAQQAIPVMVHEPATLNCWAPEIFWDEKREQFLIFWASAVTNRFRETIVTAEDVSNQRFYCTTTKDFKTFSPTRLFYDPGCSAIDATLLAANGRFYLFFKEETSRPPRKSLRVAVADDPQGPFGPAGESFSPGWVEGPAVFPVGGEYVALFHYYMNNRFGGMKSKDLKEWQDVTDRIKLPEDAHQGTVLQVPHQVLLSLWKLGRVEIGPTPIAAELGLGNWIWPANVDDKQTCRLWHSFDVPQGTLVSRAILRITADNGYRAFLDGREIGRGGDLNSLTEYDLTRLVSPGTHTLAVEGFNDALNAGVILGLHVELSNGQKVEVLSDRSWRVVPTDEPKWEARLQPKADWPHARLVAFAGRQVWSRPDKVILSPPLLPLITRFWQQGWFLFLLLSLCALVLIFSVWLGLQLAVQSRSHRLLRRERDRIARDIHDDLGAGLTQLTLLGELVLRETPHNAETRSRLDALCGKSRSLLSSMDEIVWTVNSRRDTVHDFAVFVCEHTQEFFNSTSIRCRLDVADDLPSISLDLPARRNLLLAVKEAVRNAATHSGATEVLLQIRVADQRLRVVVEDNGKGLPLNPSATRNGLRNMTERMADVGGVCRVASAPDQGCRIIFTLPLETPKLARRWLSPLAQKILSWRKATEPDP